MIVKFLSVLSFLASVPAFSYDCSQAQPFTPFEPQKVMVSVDRFYWTVEDGQQIQKSEQVCETSAPLATKRKLVVQSVTHMGKTSF